MLSPFQAANKKAAEEVARVKHEAAHQVAEAEQRADTLAKQVQNTQVPPFLDPPPPFPSAEWVGS